MFIVMIEYYDTQKYFFDNILFEIWNEYFVCYVRLINVCCIYEGLIYHAEHDKG